MVSNGCGRLRDRLRLLFLYCVAFPRTTRGILSWNLHWAILSYRRAGAGYCCYRRVRSMNRGERCDRPSWDRNCRMLPTTIVWQRRQCAEVVHGSGGCILSVDNKIALYMLRSRQNSLRFSGEAFVHSKTWMRSSSVAQFPKYLYNVFFSIHYINRKTGYIPSNKIKFFWEKWSVDLCFYSLLVDFRGILVGFRYSVARNFYK